MLVSCSIASVPARPGTLRTAEEIAPALPFRAGIGEGVRRAILTPVLLSAAAVGEDVLRADGLDEARVLVVALVTPKAGYDA